MHPNPPGASSLPLLAAAAFLLAAALPLAAATVSVSTLEEDPEASPGAAGLAATGALDAFFSTGAIVTSDAPLVLPRAAWESWMPPFEPAREGRVDYILVLFLDWPARQTKPATPVLPVSASWKLFAVAEGSLAASGALAPRGNPMNADEIRRSLLRMGGEAGEQAAAVLDGRMTGGKP